jgi:dUTP pyrophosphatase
MEKIGVKIKLLHPDAKIPKYGSSEAAGFDLYSVEDATILPGELKMIHTGISLEFPNGFHVQIWDRSGKAKEGVHLFAGVADSDYRGEYRILAYNASKEPHKIEKGDRVAQALLVPILRAEFEQVEELSDSERGAGGFHSTGKK